MASNRVFPIIIQLVVFYFVISLVVRAIRRRRAEEQKQPPTRVARPESTASPAAPADAPKVSNRVGRVRREERLYNGVVWQIVHRPHHSLTEGAGSRVAGEDLYVEEPPRCPKCGLGVLESHSWLRGYVWACPECGTRARSPLSIEQTARALARIRR